MKHKVSELEGALLDAAVAKAENRPADMQVSQWRLANFEPSTSWADGGPIIEREHISLLSLGDEGWSANFEIGWNTGELQTPHLGPTALIAAMRAHVASKFGEEVELP